jgi:hypothetical protein
MGFVFQTALAYAILGGRGPPVHLFVLETDQLLALETAFAPKGEPAHANGDMVDSLAKSNARNILEVPADATILKTSTVAETARPAALVFARETIAAQTAPSNVQPAYMVNASTPGAALAILAGPARSAVCHVLQLLLAHLLARATENAPSSVAI